MVMATVSYFWIKNIHIEQTKIDLLHNIDIFSLQIKDFNDIDNVVKKVREATGLRVTIIDDEGVVIGESDKDKASMDNHLNRTEILKLLISKGAKLKVKSDKGMTAKKYAKQSNAKEALIIIEEALS